MTSQLEVPAALDWAHAGDLVGYDKWGRPMYLPGGGARDGAITAEPDDDDMDGGGGADEDDDPDDGPPTKAGKPSYRQLLEQNAALSAQLDPDTRRRMNAENRRLRGVRQFAEKHKITDLDAWLAGLNIDPETGKPKAAAPEPNGKPAEPAKATTPAETTGGQTEPESEEAPTGFDQAEFDRMVEAKVEERLAEEEGSGRSDLLLQVIQTTSVEAELAKAGFSGSMIKALRVLDLDAVTVDDDGTVIGAEEAVSSLKEEIPEWFKARTAPGARKEPRETGGEDVDGGGKPGRKPAEADWAKKAVDAMVSGRNR
jgi:hypothetical protein